METDHKKQPPIYTNSHRIFLVWSVSTRVHLWFLFLTAYNLFCMSQAGIYIHIPFCRSHCSYCDFATGMYESELAERYVSSVITEITQWSEVETSSAADTIYFGGGTPSLLEPDQIEPILKAVHDRFDVIDGAEVTIELNPASVGAQQANIHRRDASVAEVAQRNNETELRSQKLR